MSLWRHSFEIGAGVVDPHSIDEQAAYFRTEVLPNCDVRVATDGATLVGFIAATPSRIDRSWPARRPGWVRQGAPRGSWRPPCRFPSSTVDASKRGWRRPSRASGCCWPPRKWRVPCCRCAKARSAWLRCTPGRGTPTPPKRSRPSATRSASDLLDLLDVQRGAQQALVGLSVALSDRHRQFVGLQRAVGARFVDVEAQSRSSALAGGPLSTLHSPLLHRSES